MIPPSLDNLCRLIPACILSLDATQLRLAVTALPAEEMIESLRFTSQRQVSFEFWPLARIEAFRQQPDSAPSPPAAGPPESGNIPEIAGQLLDLAVRLRASDIHIEPTPQGIRARLRIDGILTPCPLALPCPANSLIARFKILAGVDIAENRLPQDGQLSGESGGERQSFRLSTLPTQFGEKVVLRRLQTLSTALTPAELGLDPEALAQLLAVLQQPQGMILVTGPTGSGKTFTLYSLLNALNTPDKNLSTVEDPIEMTLPGINQTQINTRAGLDFARILRALLRQDPDVIMIGEIRDNETADIAVKAAQTGHLVFSTLHTNSTPEAVTRLRQMGIAGYLLAASLRLVIAQRLVRRLCRHCRRLADDKLPCPPGLQRPAIPHWLAGGCDHCFGGYYGRFAIFEILAVTGDLHQAIAANVSSQELKVIASRQGMQPLFVSGLNAVSRAETSWAEVLRVTGGSDE